MASKKKPIGKVDIKEGALKAIGWPSAQAIINNIKNGKVDRKTAVARLNYIAVMSKNKSPETSKKARAIIARIQMALGKSESKKKK